MPVLRDRDFNYGEEVCGGKGRMKRDFLVTGDDLGGKVILLNRVVLDPGASIGVHPHIKETELYFITEGSGLYTEDGVQTEVGVGDAMFCPDGSYHGIENTGDVPLAFVACVQDRS